MLPSSACSRSICRERGGRAEQMALIEGGSGSGSEDVEGGPHRGAAAAEADVLALPPLPEPDRCQMRAEACCGNSLVCFLIFIFVAPIQTYANATEPEKITFMMRVWIFAIYAEAVIAIICLLGLMWGDPGTIKRTVGDEEFAAWMATPFANCEMRSFVLHA